MAGLFAASPPPRQEKWERRPGKVRRVVLVKPRDQTERRPVAAAFLSIL
jgi:hypothetical protein